MEGIWNENQEWLDSKIVDFAFFSYKYGMRYDWIPLRRIP
mgnify:FL=1